MNTEELEGKWEQIKGQVKEKWGKLSNDDITTIGGKKDQLIGKIRERYALGKEDAENQFAAFVRDCNCDSSSKSGNSNEKPTSSGSLRSL